MIRNEKRFYQLISILLALSLWLYVTVSDNSKMTQQIKDIPIQIKNVPAGLTIASVSDPKVVLQVRGRSFLTSALEDKEELVYVEMGNGKAGKNTVPIKVSLPSNMELISIIPEQVDVELEQIKEKKMEVQVQVRGKTENGKSPMPVDVDPQFVKISGAESVVKKVSSAIADIKIGEHVEGIITENADVKVYDNSGKVLNGLIITPKKIKVSLSFVPAKLVPITLRTIGSLPSGFEVSRIELNPDKISVKGSEIYINNVDTINTVPLDLNGSMVSFTRRIELELPTGIYLTDGELPRVSVFIHQIAVEKIFSDIPVSTSGLQKNCQAVVDPAKITITVSGDKQVVDGLTSGSIPVSVDLSNYGPGEYDLPIIAGVPAGVNIVSIPKVHVIISVASGGR